MLNNVGESFADIILSRGFDDNQLLSQCARSRLHITRVEFCHGIESNIKNVRGLFRPRTKRGLRSRAFMFPDAHLARLRHEEQAQYKANCGNSDWVDQRIGETAGCLIGRRRDERH